MASENIETKVEKLLQPIIENLGYTIYDVKYEKEAKDYYLRIIIDNEKGIDIDDCVKVNDAINDILDTADYIKDQYFLEVSSPGIERVLRKDKHYEAQIGKEIQVKLFKPIEKQKEFNGILDGFSKEENSITLKMDDKILKIDIKDIALAKTIYNW